LRVVPVPEVPGTVNVAPLVPVAFTPVNSHVPFTTPSAPLANVMLKGTLAVVWHSSVAPLSIRKPSLFSVLLCTVMVVAALAISLVVPPDAVSLPSVMLATSTFTVPPFGKMRLRRS